MPVLEEEKEKRRTVNALWCGTAAGWLPGLPQGNARAICATLLKSRHDTKLRATARLGIVPGGDPWLYRVERTFRAVRVAGIRNVIARASTASVRSSPLRGTCTHAAALLITGGNMPVSVVIPTPLRGFANGMRSVVVDGDTVGAALDDLTARFPTLRAQLYAGDTLRTFVNIFINDENMRDVGGPAAALAAGDTISIIPSIAGG